MWIDNRGGHEIRFVVNGEECAVLSSGIVKMLNFTSNSNENRTFYGWYVDRECTKPFNATAFTEDTTTLYGRWSDYTAIIIITPSSSSSTEQVFFTVEIVLSAKSIVTDDEIKAEIKKIVGDEHAVKIEVIREDNGQAVVITKFVDPEVDEGTVNEFATSIKESDRLKDEVLDIKAFDWTRVEEGEGSSNTTVIIIVVVILALFFMKRRGSLSSRGLAVRSRVVAVDSLKTGGRGQVQERVQAPKVDLLRGVQGAKEHQERAFMKAESWRRRRSPQRERERGLRASVPSEC